ncbi:hypothetical protein [Hydrogenophaga sp.]|uniref:hypothetical protein n=1 Tax=Hydrogenophaga sp. TaxID=1904254 RepID=UPI00273153D4|nr:hypothetical protein [Hydrogenophaga sp.]MDP2018180.1 hypothetical protein [Hydrogenophaga sp.]MDP3165448.1 hypothetical protein [Hydrogenophaga sp.]MDP3812018.1 hypothetical protein [Hydrogenophaga sp.]MDZ4359362.1 hypothetical protein [Variovorax sp.]
MKRSLLCLSMLLATSVFAKLPAPVLTDEAKAKAEEAKAKTAWAAKVDNYKLCLSMDRAAGNYFKTAATSGKSVKPAAALPACADPGPFTYVAVAAVAVAKPVEAAGAHSPSTTAASPPSGKAPAAVPTPAK